MPEALIKLALFAAAIVALTFFAARLAPTASAPPAAPEPPPAPARTAHDYRVAVAAAEKFASANSGTVAEWERAFVQMLTAQGLAISTTRATGDAYPYGHALPAEQLGRFFPREFAPYIVWSDKP